MERGLKILTPEQMLQRLPIALALALVLVKVGTTSENLLNKIRQIMCYRYQGKEITKKSIQKQQNEFNKVIKKNGYYIYEFWE